MTNEQLNQAKQICDEQGWSIIEIIKTTPEKQLFQFLRKRQLPIHTFHLPSNVSTELIAKFIDPSIGTTSKGTHLTPEPSYSWFAK